MSRLFTGRGSAACVTFLVLVAHGAEPARAQESSSNTTTDPEGAKPAGQDSGDPGRERVAKAAPAKPSEAPLPSCLTPTLAEELRATLEPRGVQKRDFLKNKKVVLVGRGGLFSADLLSSSYSYGGSLGFFFTEDFGIELSFDVTPVALDLDKPLAEFFGDPRFVDGTGYLALASLLWTPIHAKLEIGDSIVHSDFMLVAGAGRLFHDSVQGVTFDAGMMIDLFTTRWLTFRFDVRDVIALQEAVAETRLTNNILAMLGVVFWIPTGL